MIRRIFYMKKKEKNELIKKIEEYKSAMLNYSSWEQDFGFLLLMMNKKITYSINFVINILSKQLNDSEYIHDDDIRKEFDNIVQEIYSSLSENYKKFLTMKYFSSNDELIRFISESVYSELLKSSIENNNSKIQKKYTNDLYNVLNNKKK